jgi:hypothetical protein
MRGVNSLGHTENLARKSTATKRERRPSADTMNALRGALSREWDSLPVDHPRRRPTLAVLRFMREDGGGAP